MTTYHYCVYENDPGFSGVNIFLEKYTAVVRQVYPDRIEFSIPDNAELTEFNKHYSAIQPVSSS
jgi:hypothetical protein